MPLPPVLIEEYHPPLPVLTREMLTSGFHDAGELDFLPSYFPVEEGSNQLVETANTWVAAIPQTTKSERSGLLSILPSEYGKTNLVRVLASGIYQDVYDVHLTAVSSGVGVVGYQGDPTLTTGITDIGIELLGLGHEVRLKKGTSSDSLPVSLRDNWQRIAVSGLSDKISKKIEKLSRKPDGWRGEGSRLLSSTSLRFFLMFWEMIKGKAIEPFVTLSPNGNLVAEWHQSWKKHLDLEFDADGYIYFGLFSGLKVIEGRESLKELAAMLLAREQNPFRWHG